MTANAGYHAYATGDVLTAAQVQYNLQNQTVMYFASSTARTTALSGVLVEGMVSYIPANGLEYYNGSAWVLVAADQTPLTTKGDLFTYSTTDARLPVGSDGQTLVANSAATTGLQWASTPSASNPVLNSAMQVWQRNTTRVGASGGVYTADRWFMYALSQATTTRQTTNDTTNLPNIQYCARVQRNSGSSDTSGIPFSQSFESINSIPFAGKTVTFSYYARAGANYSPTSSLLGGTLYSGTGTDQNYETAYTGGTAVAGGSITLTTTWQRFTATGTVAATATELAVRFNFAPTGTAGTNDYFEVTGVQIDIGSVALPFRTFSQTLQGELAACQRYYWRAGGDNLYQQFSTGYATSTTNANSVIYSPVSMRVAPTSLDFSTLTIGDGVTAYTVTNLTLNQAGKLQTSVNITVASGLTVYRPYGFGANNSLSAYVGLNAEL